MNAQILLNSAAVLLAKEGWRKGVYTTVCKENKNKILYHRDSLPCPTCDKHSPIIGLTIVDALAKAFKAGGRPFPIHKGKIWRDIISKEGLAVMRQDCSDHEYPLFEAKCLMARVDTTIKVMDVSKEPAYLYPLFVNLMEWNDRKDQTKENIIRVLKLAEAGNIPNETKIT